LEYGDNGWAIVYTYSHAREKELALEKKERIELDRLDECSNFHSLESIRNGRRRLKDCHCIPRSRHCNSNDCMGLPWACNNRYSNRNCPYLRTATVAVAAGEGPELSLECSIKGSEDDKDLAALAEASDSDGSAKVSIPDPDLVLAPTKSFELRLPTRHFMVVSEGMMKEIKKDLDSQALSWPHG
ncbi:hypothetical protein D5086_006274, partial [Populus alba]